MRIYPIIWMAQSPKKMLLIISLQSFYLIMVNCLLSFNRQYHWALWLFRTALYGNTHHMELKQYIHVHDIRAHVFCGCCYCWGQWRMALAMALALVNEWEFTIILTSGIKPAIIAIVYNFVNLMFYKYDQM